MGKIKEGEIGSWWWMRGASFRKYCTPDEWSAAVRRSAASVARTDCLSSQSLHPVSGLPDTTRQYCVRKPRTNPFSGKIVKTHNSLWHLLFKLPKNLKVAENDCRGSRWCSVDRRTRALHGWSILTGIINVNVRVTKYMCLLQACPLPTRISCYNHEKAQTSNLQFYLMSQTSEQDSSCDNGMAKHVNYL